MVNARHQALLGGKEVTDHDAEALVRTASVITVSLVIEAQ
jgi:hypothetical protein